MFLCWIVLAAAASATIAAVVAASFGGSLERLDLGSTLLGM